MSLSDLASLGSFISGIAVMGSFVFLALQMRQANLNQRSQMQQARAARVIDSMYRRLDPHLSEIFERGNRGDLTLSDAQVEMFASAAFTSFVTWEDTYLQHRAGTLDPASWKTDEARIRLVLSTPAYRALWRTSRIYFTGDYLDFVDKILRDTKVVLPSNAASLWKTYIAEEMASV
jgi:hypothetical protein